MGKPDTADFASHDHLMQVLVPLNVHEELQHVIGEKVELVLIDVTLFGIIEQQPEKERPLILIVRFAKGNGQVTATIGFLVDTPVAFSAESDSVSRLHRAPGIKGLAHDVMRLDTLFRFTAHAAI